jgi:Protein of unknown function (DUF2796)
MARLNPASRLDLRMFWPRSISRLCGLVPALVLLALFTAAPARAADPHQHGVARLDAALDGRMLTLAFASPLDNLLGFERKPRNEVERQAAQALVERWRGDATGLLRPDPAAGCRLVAVELESAVLGVGAASAGAGEHAELEAEWRFECAEPARLAFIELGLIAAYPRLKRVEVQIATAGGQRRQLLSRSASRLAWPR